MENVSVVCPVPPDVVPKVDVEFVIASVCLIIIICAVLFGNCLVVLSVLTTRKLRTVTNIFIVNLACADLLLGVFVLPFSAALELLDVWVFGKLWCSMWLAIDVWLCTASIFNLCCISLDRYLAITHPMKYPNLMSSRRARFLLGAIWIISFVICFPPLVDWGSNGADQLDALDSDLAANLSYAFDADFLNFTSNFSAFEALANVQQPVAGGKTCVVPDLKCELTSTTGYRIYACMGSFYIPMIVMVFFYIKIYRAAVRTIAAYEKGVLTTKPNGEVGPGSTSTETLTLRVHRGGGGGGGGGAGGSGMGGGGRTRSVRAKCSVSEPPSPRGGMGGQQRGRGDPADLCCGMATPLLPSPHGRHHRHSSQRVNSWGRDNKQRASRQLSSESQSSLSVSPRPMRRPASATSMDDVMSSASTSRSRKQRHSRSETRSSMNGTRIRFTGPYSRSNTTRRNVSDCQRPSRNYKNHMRKFNREKKAAKTLAIIVGAFIVCWMPFFTIYLIGAFCTDCISSLLFSIFFWLGYCNSAINPCVYALFSRDFRFAFRKLLTCYRRQKCSSNMNSEVTSFPMNYIHSTIRNSESWSDS